MLLCGCTAADKLAVTRPGDEGLAPIELSRFCDGFLQPVPPPAATVKTDARVAYTREANALDDANGRIVAGRDCVRDERAAYAKGKTK